MKILLISPRMSLRPMDSEYKRRMAPSLALLTLGALTPDEHETVIQDENVEPLALNPDVDLVGITVNVELIHEVQEAAAMLLKHHPKAS